MCPVSSLTSSGLYCEDLDKKAISSEVDVFVVNCLILTLIVFTNNVLIMHLKIVNRNYFFFLITCIMFCQLCELSLFAIS